MDKDFLENSPKWNVLEFDFLCGHDIMVPEKLNSCFYFSVLLRHPLSPGGSETIRPESGDRGRVQRMDQCNTDGQVHFN